MPHPGISDFSRKRSSNDTPGWAEQEKGRQATARFLQKMEAQGYPAKDMPVTVRGMLPDDVNYIIDSWVQSYRHSPDMQAVDDNLYKVEMRNRVYREVAQNKVLVACNPQVQNSIYGWICFIPPQVFGHLPVVSYVYVKSSVWRRGIGSGLVDLARASGTDPDGPVWCYDWTLQMRRFADKVGMMRNPFLRECPQGKSATTAA
jgi:hypothetical protein